MEAGRSLRLRHLPQQCNRARPSVGPGIGHRIDRDRLLTRWQKHPKPAGGCLLLLSPEKGGGPKAGGIGQDLTSRRVVHARLLSARWLKRGIPGGFPHLPWSRQAILRDAVGLLPAELPKPPTDPAGVPVDIHAEDIDLGGIPLNRRHLGRVDVGHHRHHRMGIVERLDQASQPVDFLPDLRAVTGACGPLHLVAQPPGEHRWMIAKGLHGPFHRLPLLLELLGIPVIEAVPFMPKPDSHRHRGACESRRQRCPQCEQESQPLRKARQLCRPS